MTVIVVDAGVLATAVGDDGPAGAAIRPLLMSEPLAAPELIDLEVASVLRKLVATTRLPESRGRQALDDLAEFPMQRVAHTPLLARCWQLRHNLTTYDASYVAVAEAFNARLLTADSRLARAPGLRCDVELVRVG